MLKAGITSALTAISIDEHAQDCPEHIGGKIKAGPKRHMDSKLACMQKMRPNKRCTCMNRSMGPDDPVGKYDKKHQVAEIDLLNYL